MENKQVNTELQDEGRLAYMIEWRNKRIQALEDLIVNMETANMIYAAYITFLLEKCCGTRDCIKISKQSIREVCGKYTVSAQDVGDDFVIRLIEMGDANGAQSKQVAHS